MEQFNNFLLLLDSNLSGSWWFPALLIGTGIFFTIYLGFPQFRFFGNAWRLVSGNKKSDGEGETTGFEALTTAMSGAIGTGNIGGVALAIWTGGPAAIFWMWITAIFGMTTKFVEVTLGHKYRTNLEDGSISGGPMYYIEHALNMKWAGILFAFLMMITAIGSGNMPQINNIALVMNTEFAVPKLFTGLFLGILLWIIIIGGIKRIASVTSKIIPIMGLIYFGGALIILVENYQNIIPSFNAIFGQVFTGSAAMGGFLGASFAMSLKYGVARGLYSNEAGQGSSPIAHASSKNKSIDQGVVSILEPFIDTIVVCTVTALVILSSGVWTEKFDTNFSKTDMVILDGTYSDETNEDKSFLYPDDITELTKYVQKIDSNVQEFNGTLEIQDGRILNDNLTVIHLRSVAEEIKIKDTVIKKDEENSAEYKKFFDGALRKFGVTSSAELTADKKKEFSDYIDKNYNLFNGILVISKGKVSESYPFSMEQNKSKESQRIELQHLVKLYEYFYEAKVSIEAGINELGNFIGEQQGLILIEELYSELQSEVKKLELEPHEVSFKGKSLVSSAELTAKAFSNGILGSYGGKLVAIALLLFAFSTAITWCYYGDRSTAYIFGERGVFWYRNFYVLCFISAAVIDTTIVWNIAYVVVALVSIPNLIALFVLRDEMKDLTNEFISNNKS